MRISDFFRKLLNKEKSVDYSIQENKSENISLEIDEEEKIVVALAASVMAGKDKPDSRFHISKITRIK